MKSRWYPLPFNFIICIVTISFICRLYRLYVGLLVFVDFFASCLTTLWVLGWGFGDLREGGYLYIYREKIPPCSLGTRESLTESEKGPNPIYISPQRARRRGGAGRRACARVGHNFLHLISPCVRVCMRVWRMCVRRRGAIPYHYIYGVAQTTTKVYILYRSASQHVIT